MNKEIAEFSPCQFCGAPGICEDLGKCERTLSDFEKWARESGLTGSTNWGIARAGWMAALEAALEAVPSGSAYDAITALIEESK